MATSIEQWETCERSRQKVKTTTRIARRMNKGRSRNIAFLAFATVAMQANGGLQDHLSASTTDALGASHIGLKTLKARYKTATGQSRALGEQEQ
jgi:hypothetical protein